MLPLGWNKKKKKIVGHCFKSKTTLCVGSGSRTPFFFPTSRTQPKRRWQAPLSPSALLHSSRKHICLVLLLNKTIELAGVKPDNLHFSLISYHNLTCLGVIGLSAQACCILNNKPTRYNKLDGGRSRGWGGLHKFTHYRRKAGGQVDDNEQTALVA